jgi:diamine N-acetyltransferase
MSTVCLREATRENLDAIVKMDAGDGGRRVAPNVHSMAEAAVYGEAWPRAIYAGEEPVGSLMLCDPSLVIDPEDSRLFLRRLMVDVPHQREGYALAALELMIRHVRTRPHPGEMPTSIAEPAPPLLALYGKAGFEPTDEYSDGERLRRLAL